MKLKLPTTPRHFAAFPVPVHFFFSLDVDTLPGRSIVCRDGMFARDGPSSLEAILLLQDGLLTYTMIQRRAALFTIEA